MGIADKINVITEFFDDWYFPDVGDTLKIGTSKGFLANTAITKIIFSADSSLINSNRKMINVDTVSLSSAKLTRMVIVEKNLYDNKTLLLEPEFKKKCLKKETQ